MPGAERKEGGELKRRRGSGGFSQSFVQSQLRWRFFLLLRTL